MNRSLTNSSRGLVLVGGVTLMGISLAMAQLAAQQRAPGQDPNRAQRRAVQPQEDQVVPERRDVRERTSEARPGERRAPVDGRQPDRRTADGREQADSQREDQSRSRGPWLGVFLKDESTSDRGAAIAHVYPAGPAARAGFRAGDIITAVNGQQVSGPEPLIEALDRLEAGKKTEFTVLRGDQEAKLSATLTNRNAFMFSGFGNLEPGQADEWMEDHEHDEFYDIPEHAMELEAHRRLAEQHERIENLIQQLRSEVQALREELRTRR